MQDKTLVQLLMCTILQSGAYPCPLLAGLLDQPQSLLSLSLPQTEPFHLLIKSHLRRKLVKRLCGICGKSCKTNHETRRNDTARPLSQHVLPNTANRAMHPTRDLDLVSGSVLTFVLHFSALQNAPLIVY